MAAYLTGRPLVEMRVRDSMSVKILTCRETDSIEKAERTMQSAQVRRLPVTDGSGALVGILSLNDIALEAEREQRAPRPEISLTEVAQTLSAVCHRRATLSTAVAPPS